MRDSIHRGNSNIMRAYELVSEEFVPKSATFAVFSRDIHDYDNHHFGMGVKGQSYEGRLSKTP